MMQQSTNKKPDNRTYSTFLAGLIRLGKVQNAVDLVNEAFGLAGQPATLQDKMIDSEVIESLLSLLAQRGLTETMAVPLLERMRAAKVPMSAGFYTTALQRAVNQPGGRQGQGKGSARSNYQYYQ